MWVNGTSFQKLDPASGQHAAKLFIVVWERVLIPNLARNVHDYSAHKTGPVATNIEVTYLGLHLTFGMNVTGGCSPNNTLRSNCIHMVIWSHPLTGSNIWSGKALDVMTSRHENEYRIAGHFWGESISRGASPRKDSMMRNFNISFITTLNILLNKQSISWWFETPWFPCDIVFISASNQFPFWLRPWYSGYNVAAGWAFEILKAVKS